MREPTVSTMGALNRDTDVPAMGRGRQEFDRSVATDEELLWVFVSRGGHAAEAAFAALVRRHGPRVLRVCRSVLGDEQEAEDSLQETFLLLLKKARGLRVNGSIGPWLHAVAFRVASDARKAAARREKHRQRLASTSSMSYTTFTLHNEERVAALYEEICGLSANLKAAVVLCDLDGFSHSKAAATLGWPVGTVKSRQARGRERLRSRLMSRGFVFSTSGLLFLLSSERGLADVGPRLVDTTARAAVNSISGQGGTEVSAKVLEQTAAAAYTTVASGFYIAAAVAMSLVFLAPLFKHVAHFVPTNSVGVDGETWEDRATRSGIPPGSLARSQWNNPEPSGLILIGARRSDLPIVPMIKGEQGRAQNKTYKSLE
jgi:RNA polymerase sigma factor (sigma-70 family)